MACLNAILVLCLEAGGHCHSQYERAHSTGSHGYFVIVRIVDFFPVQSPGISPPVEISVRRYVVVKLKESQTKQAVDMCGKQEDRGMQRRPEKKNAKKNKKEMSRFVLWNALRYCCLVCWLVKAYVSFVVIYKLTCYKNNMLGNALCLGIKNVSEKYRGKACHKIKNSL